MKDKEKSKEKECSPVASSPLEKLELSNKPTFIITQKLKNQIDYLHKKHPNTEWSGELITREVGNINDLDKWTIIAEEIFLADVGTSGYTSYEVDKGGFKSVDIVEMFEKFPGLEEGTYKNHHIHTHHTMGCFFSGTDWDQLHDRSLVSNYFLMLIVNKAGEAIAKVAFRAIREGQKPTKLSFYNNFDGFSPLKLTDKKSDELLVVMDCKVENEIADVDAAFIDRYDRVMKALKEEEEKKKQMPPTYYGGHGGYNSGYKQGNFWKDHEGKAPGFGYQDKPGKTTDWTKEDINDWEFNSITKFWEKKKESPQKKISEMSQREWEQYEKDQSKTHKWDLRHAKAMINSIVSNSMDIDFTDCASLLIRTSAKLKTQRDIDEACDDFREALLENYQILFSEQGGSKEAYHSLLFKMKEYLSPYGYITIVPDLITEIEEEMDETVQEMLDEHGMTENVLT